MISYYLVFSLLDTAFHPVTRDTMLPNIGIVILISMSCPETKYERGYDSIHHLNRMPSSSLGPAMQLARGCAAMGKRAYIRALTTTSHECPEAVHLDVRGGLLRRPKLASPCHLWSAPFREAKLITQHSDLDIAAASTLPAT